MSDELFPGWLPGVTWDRHRTVGFKTSVYEALSGAEVRVNHRPVAKHKISIKYEFLRQQQQAVELETLLGFYQQRKGSFDSFLMYDPYDSNSFSATFAIADGYSTTYQIARNIGGYLEPVHNVAMFDLGRVWFPTMGDIAPFWPQTVNWPDLGEYELLYGAATLLVNGIVQFPSPPPLGTKLVWTGRFYYRARFADDMLDSNEFMYRFFNIGKLDVVRSTMNIL